MCVKNGGLQRKLAPNETTYKRSLLQRGIRIKIEWNWREKMHTLMGEM